MIALFTAEEWGLIKGITVIDPDGWREPDAPPWDKPITEEDYMARAMSSTIRIERPESA